MKKIKYILGLIVASLLFNGCSNKYEVTFDSNPRGATLICNGNNWGYTPKKLYYDEKVRNYSSLDVSSFSANWVSGYKATYPKDMQIFPNGGTIVTLDRPTYGEGYPMDAQFALQVEQMQAQQAQASKAEYDESLRSIRNNLDHIQNQQNRTLEQMNNINRNMQMDNLNNNLNNINNNLNQINRNNRNFNWLAP